MTSQTSEKRNLRYFQPDRLISTTQHVESAMTGLIPKSPSINSYSSDFQSGDFDIWSLIVSPCPSTARYLESFVQFGKLKLLKSHVNYTGCSDNASVRLISSVICCFMHQYFGEIFSLSRLLCPLDVEFSLVRHIQYLHSQQLLYCSGHPLR